MSPQSGTEKSIKIQDRRTPMHWCASGGQTECAQLVNEAAARASECGTLDCADDAGWTPLHIAVRDFS